MRGKTKIGMSAFLSSMLLVSFIATLGIPAVLAPTTATLTAPHIVNPLLEPGDLIPVNIIFDDTVDLWSLEFKLTFDTDLLTPVSYFFETGTAQLREVFVEDLNDAAGYVHLGATRPQFGGSGSDFLGIGNGVTTTYPLTQGVIEPGSEIAFYKVTDEFLGTAQDPLGINRDPGPWTGGGGDGKVDLMPIIPSPGSIGVERVYDDGVLYASYGSPDDPRWGVNYATGDVFSTQVPPYTSRWPATGSVMTIDYATGFGVPAIASMDYAHSGGTGSVTFAAAPAVGEEVYLQYSYRTGLTTPDVLLAASILFEVQGRGACDLAFESSAMLDQYIPSNVIAHTAVDGVFDNRLDGTMSAPHIVDTTLVTPGDYFDVFVSVGPWMGKDIEKLWGFQFKMVFDPTIIMPIDFETLEIFMPGPSEIGLDYVAVTGNSYYGDPDGLSTSVPVEVARIGFVVLDLGVSALDLQDTLMADVNGVNLIHETFDGSFANTENISVSLNTLFVAGRKWTASVEGNLFTLTAQVTNTGLGITKTRAHFVVTNALGMIVADLTTSDTNIWPGTTIRLATDLNVGPLDKPASYVVEGTVEYLNHLGMWVTGQKGSPTGARSSMVKTFTLFP